MLDTEEGGINRKAIKSVILSLFVMSLKRHKNEKEYQLVKVLNMEKEKTTDDFQFWLTVILLCH